MAQAYTTALFAILMALLGYILFDRERQRQNFSVQIMPTSPDRKLPNALREADSGMEALADFDYTQVTPVKYRPFLAETHIFMGTFKCPQEDWIQIDRGYLDRIKQRQANLAAHTEAIAINDVCVPAVRELFMKVIRHLLIRFPKMFSLERHIFCNHATGMEHNLNKVIEEPRNMLKLLSESIEEDLYIMVPDSEGVYSLQGFESCFPNGFLSFGKLGLSMQEIHGPVPTLNESIGVKIDAYMRRLQNGAISQRLGWSLQFSGPALWCTGGNNFYPKRGVVLPEVSEKHDLSKCYLRVERQTLSRLEKSRAIVFSIRQYMTPIQKIKEEGNGPRLADAIASMPEKVGYYKMRPFWQRDVNAFLRG